MAHHIEGTTGREKFVIHNGIDENLVHFKPCDQHASIRYIAGFVISVNLGLTFFFTESGLKLKPAGVNATCSNIKSAQACSFYIHMQESNEGLTRLFGEICQSHEEES